jgi:hypothetical protein
MKLPVPLGAALLLLTTSSHADPPASPPPSPSGVRCSVTAASTHFVAAFDFATMSGTVTSDGGASPRRFNIKATPYAATYNLVFQGYGPDDQKPASESLTRGKSVVARLVAYGDVSHLFFDADVHATVPAPMDGFVCK